MTPWEISIANLTAPPYQPPVERSHHGKVRGMVAASKALSEAIEAKVIDFLRAHGPATRIQIRDGASICEGTISLVLRRMVQDGKLCRVMGDAHVRQQYGIVERNSDA